MIKEIYLGINIDHVATLRQARGTRYPDPVHAAFEAINGGADNITLHLREDGRHIQERDVCMIKDMLSVPMNFEMAVTPRMVNFAEKIQPALACFVPEKREELTTEGGLDVINHLNEVASAVKRLQKIGTQVSLFVDPDIKQIDAVVASGATEIEIHTGRYADAENKSLQEEELNRILESAHYAHQKGLVVHAGHGLHYQNVQAIAQINVIHTLNIGHAVIARAIFCGLQEAVKEIKKIMQISRQKVHA